jgi:hypothetical protein
MNDQLNEVSQVFRLIPAINVDIVSQNPKAQRFSRVFRPIDCLCLGPFSGYHVSIRLTFWFSQNLVFV